MQCIIYQVAKIIAYLQTCTFTYKYGRLWLPSSEYLNASYMYVNNLEKFEGIFVDIAKCWTTSPKRALQGHKKKEKTYSMAVDMSDKK